MWDNESREIDKEIILIVIGEKIYWESCAKRGVGFRGPKRTLFFLKFCLSSTLNLIVFERDYTSLEQKQK